MKSKSAIILHRLAKTLTLLRHNLFVSAKIVYVSCLVVDALRDGSCAVLEKS